MFDAGNNFHQGCNLAKGGGIDVDAEPALTVTISTANITTRGIDEICSELMTERVARRPASHLSLTNPSRCHSQRSSCTAVFFSEGRDATARIVNFTVVSLGACAVSGKVGLRRRYAGGGDVDGLQEHSRNRRQCPNPNPNPRNSRSKNLRGIQQYRPAHKKATHEEVIMKYGKQKALTLVST